MDFSLLIGCPGDRQALPLHACVEYPQDKVEDAMIAEFTLRSAPRHRQVREDECDELRLGELNGNRRRSSTFCHIAHRKWVDEKPERSSSKSPILDIIQRVTEPTKLATTYLTETSAEESYTRAPAETHLWKRQPAVLWSTH